MNKSELIAALEARIHKNQITNAANPYDSRPLVENTGLHYAIALAHKLDEKPGEGLSPDFATLQGREAYRTKGDA